MAAPQTLRIEKGGSPASIVLLLVVGLALLWYGSTHVSLPWAAAVKKVASTQNTDLKKATKAKGNPITAIAPNHSHSVGSSLKIVAAGPAINSNLLGKFFTWLGL